jgi:hypothetical protein
MYNILAAGKPIIAVTNFDSELAYVIEEEGVGWLVPPGSPDLLAETILRARQRLAEDAEMPARARRAAEKYTLDRAVRAYEAVVRDLSEPELPVVATNTQPSPPSHPERDPAEDAESPTPATAWQTLEIRGEDAHGGERSIEYRSPS